MVCSFGAKCFGIPGSHTVDFSGFLIGPLKDSDFQGNITGCSYVIFARVSEQRLNRQLWNEF